MKKYIVTLFLLYAGMNLHSQTPLLGSLQNRQFPNSKLLGQLLLEHRQKLLPVIDQPSRYRLQIIYTQINRDKKNKPSFDHHFYNVSSEYNYPASTVKLPAAVLALEKINELKDRGVDKHTAMLTAPVRPNEKPVITDTSNASGQPSIANYIRKICLVSDNDAYNRLYEWLGQEGFNNRLHQLGFADAQIVHRLELALTETENRTTNAVTFAAPDGSTLWQQPVQVSTLKYAQRNDYLGKGYKQNRQLIQEPMDFSKKNCWPLPYIHQLVQWIMFPESQPKNQALKLTNDDYRFLQKHMSMLPHESQFPRYDSSHQWPTYVKFLYYGSERNIALKPGLRIFNKVGDAYGFLLDGAYFADFETGVEFILSAVVYCNEDGILNDNQYDYDTIGFPFMKQLGQVIYQYELGRPRKHLPDLSGFKFDYSH
jgi:hypothetical protein